MGGGGGGHCPTHPPPLDPPPLRKTLPQAPITAVLRQIVQQWKRQYISAIPPPRADAFFREGRLMAPFPDYWPFASTTRRRCLRLADHVYLGQTVSTGYGPPCPCAPRASGAPDPSAPPSPPLRSAPCLRQAPPPLRLMCRAPILMPSGAHQYSTLSYRGIRR